MPAEYYDFVPLPRRKGQAPDAEALTHAQHVAGRYSGYLDLGIVTKSPVHIGTGAYELSENAGLEAGTVVKAMAQVAGEPVIPSSSLKGALRSVYETITYSCVHRFRKRASEKYSRNREKSELPQTLIDELPEVLQQQVEDERRVRRISVRLDQGELSGVKQCRLRKGQRNFRRLCPACALFGIENFQGRVSFDDAEIVEMPRELKEPVILPRLYGPRLHRLGESKVEDRGRGSFIKMIRLKGRKAYYNVHLGEVPAVGQVPVDHLPQESKLCTKLHFHNVTLAELGGIFTALGLDPEYPFPFRVGGGKPVGLGYVAFELQSIHVLNEEMAFTEFEPSAAKPVMAEDCLRAFRQSEGTLFYKRGLEKLCEITARAYVPAEEERR